MSASLNTTPLPISNATPASVTADENPSPATEPVTDALPFTVAPRTGLHKPHAFKAILAEASSSETTTAPAPASTSTTTVRPADWHTTQTTSVVEDIRYIRDNLFNPTADKAMFFATIIKLPSRVASAQG